jgi:hypothetical protein
VSTMTRERASYLMARLGLEALAELSAPLTDEQAARVDEALQRYAAEDAQKMPPTALVERTFTGDGEIADPDAFAVLVDEDRRNAYLAENGGAQ